MRPTCSLGLRPKCCVQNREFRVQYGTVLGEKPNMQYIRLGDNRLADNAAEIFQSESREQRAKWAMGGGKARKRNRSRTHFPRATDQRESIVE